MCATTTCIVYSVSACLYMNLIPFQEDTNCFDIFTVRPVQLVVYDCSNQLVACWSLPRLMYTYMTRLYPCMYMYSTCLIVYRHDNLSGNMDFLKAPDYCFISVRVHVVFNNNNFPLHVQ